MGLFSKIFGKKSEYGTHIELIEETLDGLLERADLDLSHDIGEKDEKVVVELFGEDEQLLTNKDGALLDAIQLFLKRCVQHQFSDNPVDVLVDSNKFREEANKSLVELVDRLKEKALDQGRSVYLRALPPKDRKVVHQYLADDSTVKSRSVGDGLYKKIKIFPVKKGERANAH